MDSYLNRHEVEQVQGKFSPESFIELTPYKILLGYFRIYDKGDGIAINICKNRILEYQKQNKVNYLEERHIIPILNFILEVENGLIPPDIRQHGLNDLGLVLSRSASGFYYQ